MERIFHPFSAHSTTLSHPPAASPGMWRTTASELTWDEQDVLLTGQLDSTHRLRSFLHVSVARDEEGWLIVSDTIFLQWGEGPSVDSAFADYRSTLAEYYDLVREGAKSCATDRIELQRLQMYIEA